jgi:hypothetical protein
MQIPLLRRAVLMAAGLCGFWAASCGAAGGSDGGGQGLPDRGIVPYEKLAPLPDAEVPFLVEAGGNPAALVVDGRIELLYDSEEGVHHAGVDAQLGLTTSTLVMAGISQPAVTRTSGGFAVAYVAGDAVQVSMVAGPTDFGGAVLASIEGASSPSLVARGDELLVYVTRDLAIELHVVGADGSVRDEGVVLDSQEDCLDESEDPCWDRMGVSDAEVRVAQTALGRTVYRLMYTGVGASLNRGIGFAASFDGVTFSRYPFNPVFSESGRESQPSNVKLGEQYVLFFRDRVGVDEGLGNADLVVDSPSDRF